MTRWICIRWTHLLASKLVSHEDVVAIKIKPNLLVLGSMHKTADLHINISGHSMCHS